MSEQVKKQPDELKPLICVSPTLKVRVSGKLQSFKNFRDNGFF